MMFLFLVCGVLCVCLLFPARGGERREILGRWSLLGLQLKNLNEGFNTGVLFFYTYIQRNSNDGIYVNFFT
jgi:hypothetical protein